MNHTALIFLHIKKAAASAEAIIKWSWLVICLPLFSACHALLLVAEKPIWAWLMQPCRHSSKRWGWWSTPHTPCGWSLLWGHWAPHLLICFGVHLEPGFFFLSGLLCKKEGHFLIESITGEPGKGRLWWVFCGQDSSSIKVKSNIYSILCCCFFSPTRHASLLHFLFLSVLFARGQFVTENTSFSHLVAAIQWLVCTNKHVKQGWHAPSSPLKPFSTDIKYVLPALSATVSLPVSHLQWVSPAWGGLHKLLPWESRASSLSRTPETRLTVN